jgi:hypothetical protein
MSEHGTRAASALPTWVREIELGTTARLMGTQAMTRMDTCVLFDLVEPVQSNSRPILVGEYQTQESELK